MVEPDKIWIIVRMMYKKTSDIVSLLYFYFSKLEISRETPRFQILEKIARPRSRLSKVLNRWPEDVVSSSRTILSSEFESEFLSTSTLVTMIFSS